MKNRSKFNHTKILRLNYPHSERNE